MARNHDAPPGAMTIVAGMLCLAAGTCMAAPFDLDPGYGAQGRVTFSTGQTDARIARSVLQADGKLVVTGSRATTVGALAGTELFARRFNIDGAPDSGFGINGESRFSVHGSDAINMITLQADGKIVLAVDAREPCTPLQFGGCINGAGQNAPFVSAIVRLRTDGALDATLGGKGYVEAADFYLGYAVAVQPDGKLLILGTTSVARARIYNWKLARFNADGSRDTTFNGGQTVSSRCPAYGYSVVVQADGGIVVGGNDGAYYVDSTLNPGFCIERRLADGSPDLAFNKGQLWTWLGMNVSFSSLTELPGGKLLALGRGLRENDTPTQTVLDTGVVAVRYGSNGVIDSGYGAGGTWFAPLANSTSSFVNGDLVYAPGSSLYVYVDFTFARDGGVVAAGYDYPSAASATPPRRTVLLKVAESGQVDPAFGVNGVARSATHPDLAAGFLRDLEDRWFLVSTTTLPDLNTGGLIERYRGERPDSVPVIEFYNFNLRHYFITASAAEAAGIDAGTAGPGWQRTGETFRAWQPLAPGSLTGVPQLAQSLCRFYGTPGRGPNSHFYTISAPECDFVRKDPGWTFENYAFYAYAPTTAAAGNSCRGGLPPVYRAYNNRYAQNDSNHRYTTNSTTYQQMQQLGWTGEGIVFCAAAQ